MHFVTPTEVWFQRNRDFPTEDDNYALSWGPAQPQLVCRFLLLLLTRGNKVKLLVFRLILRGFKKVKTLKS